MENYFGQYGWREFNRNRLDILAELDKIIEQTKNRPIKVAHGNGVEAILRKWLSEFLPKKYGVTSGYVIPNLYSENITLYHYDIIIFNQLDSPVLWTEGNFDQSEQGKFRAIPAKHVVAVYEVKSRLTKQNIVASFTKLNQTADFKNQLNPLYSCGIIFIDLKEKENNNESIIKELFKGKDIYGFNGGMILRYENDHTAIGHIKLYKSESLREDKNRCKPIAKPIDDLDIYLTEDNNITVAEPGGGMKLLKTGEKEWAVSKTYGIVYSEESDLIGIDWSRSNFSDFCIDLISSLEGLPLKDLNRTIFGKVFDKVELKKSPLQKPEPEKGQPFLEIKLNKELKPNEKNLFDLNSPNPILTFNISVKNIGETAAIVSDNSFKNQFELPVGGMARTAISYEVEFKKGVKNLKQLFEKDKIDIPFRIVYYAINTKKDFRSIEKTIRVTKDNLQLI